MCKMSRPPETVGYNKRPRGRAPMDNWVPPWLFRHPFSQYSPTGSTQSDERGWKNGQYRAYVLRLKTYYGLRWRWMRHVLGPHTSCDRIQFLSVELTCTTLGSDHILTLFIKRRESQGHTVRGAPSKMHCSFFGPPLFFAVSPNTRFAWAGGTFFPVVVLCQFLVLAGNRFWFYIFTYAT